MGDSDFRLILSLVAYCEHGDAYSQGAQKAWLEKELAVARNDHDIDWVVVCMHQVAISTADMFNGADLGIREEWVPLFDKYGVDLVVCGHEHHYERSHPIRGRESNATLTPVPAATTTDVIDTTQGTVHMVIGGGGTSHPSNQLFFNPPACRVITGVGEPDPKTGPVSRVTPVHTALRNCTRDEGRSFEVGNQVLISNHRKLLWSKAMVVNVAEKLEQDSGRYD
jgi:3',5'-cyclic AMP phosphodiesterase CpdA